ncbi:GTPase ObgE [Spiroplasma endosymbiont of Labia minor]|uniref:GTPase ObgE n=1 Tax=Spiroplasma endosymbiont of Labia minor TaxID=3066305 RepID=UPI0030D472D8
MKFIDIANFNIKAGKGGDGAVSFRHELYVPNGGPNGGDGGDGGDVIFVGDEGKSSLLDLKIQKNYVAQDGLKGDIKNMHGKSASDLIINVPLGTLIINVKTGDIIADVVENNKHYLVAKGGKGGRGNARFATSRNKAPTIFEAGEPGQYFEIRAELKVLADVGFVGLPNAGKSTLLRAISNSKPEIGDYPFTTISPQLGVCRDKKGRTFTVADLPGLIEGASQGKGLGDEFLKHIERCRIICHVIDMSGNYATEDVFKNYQIIRQELINYNYKLENRLEIIVANKIDLEEAQINLLYFNEQIKDKKIIKISGLKKTGLDELLLAIGDALENIPTQALWNMQDENTNDNSPKIYTLESKKDDTVIENLGNGHWKISGEAIKKIYNKFPISTHDNLLVFNENMCRLGIYDQLRKRGAKNGDYVRIYDIELEWMG